MDFFQCLSLQAAREAILAAVNTVKRPSETVELLDALERVAATDYICQENLPPFNRSTVDGFAVRSADTFAAGEGIPALLLLAGEVLMGAETTLVLLPGQVAAIPTGGMLPANADAVVMIENTERHDSELVMVLKPVGPGENVIAAGEDIRSGDYIIHAGETITPQHIGMLAACGIAAVDVYRRPVIGIVSTGDEIVDVRLAPHGGQIRDINSYSIAAMLKRIGCNVRLFGIVADNYNELLMKLEQAIAVSDMVIVSGGSSVGARDYTVKAISALGQPGVLIHGVAVKPGKPTIFGLIDHVPVFGLPGHPVSAMMIVNELVRPLALALAGTFLKVYKIPARISRNVASVPGRSDFQRVRLMRREGEYWADPIFGKSGLISTMALADGIVSISPEKGGLIAGEEVEVELIR